MDYKLRQLQFSQQMFDIEVYATLLLSALRKQDERVQGEIHATECRPDVYLPDGLTNLNIKGRACVEVKLNLLYDTFAKIAHVVQQYKEAYPFDTLLIICAYKSYKEITYQDIILALKEHLGISEVLLYSIEELKEKVANLNNIINTDDTNGDDWEKTRDNLLEKAKFDIANNPTTLFLGAGVSSDAGIVGWNALLKELLKIAATQKGSTINDNDLDAVYTKCHGSSIVIARYIEQLYGNKDWKKEVGNILYANVKQSNLVDGICELIETNKISSVVTYNYDEVIEEKLQINGKISPVSIYAKSRCDRTKFPVFHVHGIVQNPANVGICESNPILTEDEYHALYKDAYLWSNIEQLHALDRNVCVLIGLSMSDPNLRRLLEFSQSGQQEQINHFVFLERKQFDTSNDTNKNQYNCIIQERIMASIGLRIIWFKNKKELPTLIKKLI